MTTSTDPGLARRRLWQLMSPTLPVGAYSYSGGLEYAIEAGWVGDADGVADWLQGQLRHTLGRVDIPLLARLYDAWRRDDRAAVVRYSHWLRASRETSELVGEDQHMGRALARLLNALDIPEAEPWTRAPETSWAALYALALVRWEIPLAEGAEAYLWAWCENQVAAAIKLVPLGQTAGQRLLLELAAPIGDAAAAGLHLDDHDIGGTAPGVAIASSLHETQYSRLFRS
ncbi:urease accessory protein UreF [Aquisalimonas asiatica]|uniref:Urease accessory protein UreF n=1 Tax=Aquisalimonas asiatica TaxID=406100 RepID=A0A1H8V7W2_9GAMM|nr:urease accessory protein UreF [Aquisalimonas asiatica]SEP11550.1 urease accessory protein [Aquisalimonas asiatica]